MNEILGASLRDGGCDFRVWAPHVSHLRVALQTGKRWDDSAQTDRVNLSKAAGGYWNGFARNVSVGDLYRFELSLNGTDYFQRLDPAARDTLHSQPARHNPGSENASIVTTNQPYAWSSFRTPDFENFLIYQFHVGSFAGRNDHLNKPIATFKDIESKFSYIRGLGFNAIEPLPIQEFTDDRSWGYNPAAFFAPESAYGSPEDLKHFVDVAHQHGLAVIFDVVYNHAGPQDNVLWEFDGWVHPQKVDHGGIYFEDGQTTDWGRGPAWWKEEVRDFFAI